MKTFYIVPKDMFLSHHHQFPDSHYVDLADGTVLLSTAGARSEEFHERWARQPGVLTVGAEYDPSPIDNNHADKLAHLGVKRGHAAKHVRQAVKKQLPLM